MHQMQNSSWSFPAGSKITRLILVFIGCVLVVTPALGQQIASSDPTGTEIATPIAAPAPHRGNISGTVFDTNNDIIPGAAVILKVPASDQYRTAIADRESV